MFISDGPILGPQAALKVEPEFSIHPFLLPRSVEEGTIDTSITWNIIYPGSYARIPGDPSGESWFERRVEVATFPRMTHIRVISRAFPWIIHVASSTEHAALTCKDVLEQVHKYLCELLSPLEMDDVTPEHRRNMSLAYRANRSQDIPAKIFTGSAGLRKMDWLAKNTMFEGLEEDKEYIAERLTVFMSGTFVLRLGENAYVKPATTQRRVVKIRGKSPGRRSPVRPAIPTLS